VVFGKRTEAPVITSRVLKVSAFGNRLAAGDNIMKFIVPHSGKTVEGKLDVYYDGNDLNGWMIVQALEGEKTVEDRVLVVLH